jgi:hypothetical protein
MGNWNLCFIHIVVVLGRLEGIRNVMADQLMAEEIVVYPDVFRAATALCASHNLAIELHRVLYAVYWNGQVEGSQCAKAGFFKEF